MNNLLIGNNSQLAFYFPEHYDRISSRNVDIESIKTKNYDRIFFLFAEQRTFLNETEDFFDSVNFHYTIKLIDGLKNYCKNIVIYSTAELWNNYDGEIKLSDSFKYNYSPYIRSKEKLCNYILSNKKKYENIIIVYPFNFNSPYRKQGFLFQKIFDSIISKEKTEIGDTNFNRDIIHPIHVVKNSILTEEDIIVGSGSLINVSKFISDLFTINNLEISNYISINTRSYKNYNRKEYFSHQKLSSYEEILNFTNYDIQKNIISRRHN